MGIKRLRVTLEKSVERYARRMMQRLDCTSTDEKSLFVLLQLFLLASYDVLQLEAQIWESAVGTMIATLTSKITWARLVAFLRESDQGYMDILRALDETSADQLTFTGFKRLYLGRMRDAGFDGSYLPKAILELMYAYVKDRDVTKYARVHQLFQFPLRPDILLDSGRKELESAVETKFANLESDLKTRPVIYDRYDFFGKYLKDYDPWENFIPKFSNGSARIACDRNSRFWFDKASMMQDRSLSQLWTDAQNNNLPLRPTSDESRFFPVPKDSSKMRGITIEPADMTYLQQGFLRSLRSYIRNHPYLSRRIDFHKPELNVELARLGSIDGSFDTIDLSDASDSVLWNQVCYDCYDLPILGMLDLIRSRRTILSDGTVIELSKFAGMGNALTFPLECLHFCKVVEQGISDIGGSVSKSRYRVYGDDIIVEHEFYGSVVAALERNGFKVNKTKSFTSQFWRFRESCGGEFIDGQDVCPVRLPRGPFERPESLDKVSVGTWVSTYIEIANSCYKRLPSVRLYLIHLIMRCLPREQYPVFTSDGSVGLISDQPTNFHLIRKPVVKGSDYDALQYTETITHGHLVVAKSDRVDIPDDVLYEYRLNQLLLRSDTVSDEKEYMDRVVNLAHYVDKSSPLYSTLLDLMKLWMVPSTDESVNLVRRQSGTTWKSTCEPDYYSG